MRWMSVSMQIMLCLRCVIVSVVDMLFTNYDMPSLFANLFLCSVC